MAVIPTVVQPQWNTWASASTTLDYNYTINQDGTYEYTVPAFIPTQVTYQEPPKPEPVTDLDWLRGQVAEICELAWAS